ncbi:MAG: GNAT family N-acetyltransferase [Jatrophihabitans sp.]
MSGGGLSIAEMDPLYRPRTDYPDDADVCEFGGVSVAVSVTNTDPASAQAQWMADREVTLVVGDDVTPDELRRLLPEFVTHAVSLAERPSAASLTLPSRDVDRCRVAREAGLTATAILAVADLGRPARAAVRPACTTMVVRDAEPVDAEPVARLWCEQAEYEARVGTLRVSAAIRAAITTGVPRYIANGSMVLVGEVDGVPSGAVVAETAEASSWSGTMLALDPVSYLAMASTTAAARGRGVASQLVTELHRRHRAAGIAASALHYSAYNPLSIPFWSRHGYRPVLTSFTCALG